MLPIRKVLATMATLVLVFSPVDAQRATPQVNALVGALTKALVGENTLTLFAPTDAAFDRSGVNLDSLSPEQIKQVLAYHVVPGAGVLSSSLSRQQRVGTVQGGALNVLKDAQGRVTVNGATVVAADVREGKAVVHFIDQLLLPASKEPEGPSTDGQLKSIVGNAVASPQLSVLVSVLTQPQFKPVLDALSGSGPFTVFAPTNAAFAAAGIDTSDVAAVTEVLKYHVIAGMGVKSNQLQPSQSVASFQGSPLQVRKSANGVTVNGANVVAADILSSNGVVHVIDQVLMPPSTVQPQSISRGEAISILSGAIRQGAPLYNQGDIEGSAQAYRSAATKVARGAMGSIKAMAEAGLKATSNASADKTAWFLRSAFDSILTSPLPQKSLLENAVATSTVSTLVSVLMKPEYAPVLSALSGNGPFTVFAPTNGAFADAGIDTSDVAAVTEVLKYHVVPATAYSVSLSATQDVPTLEGSTLKVTATNNNRRVRVNNANVVAADVLASNGVIHVIDKVLMPPRARKPSRPWGY